MRPTAPRHPAETAYTDEMRIFATDAHGCRVVIGLTPEETEFYLAYAESTMRENSPPDSEARSRYLALHDRHEIKRLQVIVAEAEARGSTKN